MDMTDDGQILLKVDIVDFDSLVQQRLLEAAKDLEFCLDEEYVDVWNALMVVIPYFSTPDQIKKLADYQAPQEWINIVAKH